MGLVNKQTNTDNKIKLVSNGNSLSASDMELLKGTQLLEKMVRNRVVIVTNNQDISWKTLVENVSGLYHIKPKMPSPSMLRAKGSFGFLSIHNTV